MSRQAWAFFFFTIFLICTYQDKHTHTHKITNFQKTWRDFEMARLMCRKCICPGSFANLFYFLFSYHVSYILFFKFSKGIAQTKFYCKNIETPISLNLLHSLCSLKAYAETYCGTLHSLGSEQLLSTGFLLCFYSKNLSK